MTSGSLHTRPLRVTEYRNGRRVRVIRRQHTSREKSRPRGPAWLRYPYLVEYSMFALTILACIAAVFFIKAVQAG